MKIYNVTIRATITKTLRIEAENEDDAVERAYEDFTVVCDGVEERYSQDVVDVADIGCEA